MRGQQDNWNMMSQQKRSRHHQKRLEQKCVTN